MALPVAPTLGADLDHVGWPPVSSWNFADVWEVVAETLPNAPAALHGTARMTWAELDCHADAVAGWLLDGQLGPGTTVGLYMYSAPEYLVGLFAAFKVGLPPVNTNYRYGGEAVSYTHLRAHET